MTIKSVDFPFLQASFKYPGKLFASPFSYSTPFVTNSESPNGKAYFLFKFTGRFCLGPDITMVNEEYGVWKGPHYYNGVSGKAKGDCYGMAWSEDGTELALYARPIENPDEGDLHVIILNQRAERLREFYVKAQGTEYGLDYLYWNGDEFYLNSANSYAQSEEQKPARLYRFYGRHPEQVTHLVDLPRFFQIIGKDPDSGCILLNSFDRRDTCQTIVFNPDTRKEEKLVEVEGPCFRFSRSQDNRKIALIIKNKDLGMKIYFWDWQALSYRYGGTAIRPYFFWQNDLGGLLLERKDENGRYYFDVVLPD